jgi:PAS domain S-box-containing protein
MPIRYTEKRKNMTKIVAIDDNQDNLLVLSAIFRSMLPEFTLFTAQSGEQGLELVKKEMPDTVLLDVQMPGMNGFDVCKSLQDNSNTKHIPIIMITAVHKDAGSRARGLEAGADAFLTKPIEEVELVAQIQAMLRIKRAEDLLRKKLDESESRYKVLTELSPVGVFYADRDGLRTYVNHCWCRIAGISKETAMGTGWTHALHPEDRVRVMGEWSMTVKQRTSYFAEYRFQRPDGTISWVLAQATAQCDENENLVGYVGTITDISDRKQLENQLTELNIELDARVRERTKELRTVVNAMTGRELRMVELKKINEQLREELEKR